MSSGSLVRAVNLKSPHLPHFSPINEFGGFAGESYLSSP